MHLSIFKTRFIGYLVLFSVISWFLFNFLLNRQSTIMHKYFIEKPASYNLERAERLASSIYQSFKQEVPSPSIDNIRSFVTKYNDIPFLSVDFVYQGDDGLMRSVLNEVQEMDILSAEYVYPVNYANKEIGTLLVYDINREYKRGLEEYTHMINITKLFFAVLLLMILFVVLFREYNNVIEHQKRIAEYQAVHDGLTGLFTHQYFKGHLAKEVSRAQRYGHPVSLIMCDVDNFKGFNDTYGHLIGDAVLKTVAHIIGGNVRTFDIVGRYGGEEFSVLIIESGAENAASISKRLKSLTEQAIEIADRIKTEVEQTQIKVEQNYVGVTLSLGVSSYNGHPDYRAESLIEEADQALYRSKENGRNRITVYDPEKKEFKEILH
ncbi:MAG: GGDEF domain-containing protein [Candidatus Omnitrophota bacterium]|nr:GGDEF domain-containing protein [Candidatus Omnitrophota bacterium]